eukprot:TRINITY_DN5688_c0_g1_i3.p1 TRINITY_DN5688_c0_g1~~TRINITY_DN5688_c0_g1_i3.p1  ORF type:complete len:1111 (-),score=167.20 TRINITY_DN5688_c0_g1_i3:172-3504(-)
MSVIFYPEGTCQEDPYNTKFYYTPLSFDRNETWWWWFSYVNPFQKLTLLSNNTDVSLKLSGNFELSFTMMDVNPYIKNVTYVPYCLSGSCVGYPDTIDGNITIEGLNFGKFRYICSYGPEVYELLGFVSSPTTIQCVFPFTDMLSPPIVGSLSSPVNLKIKVDTKSDMDNFPTSLVYFYIPPKIRGLSPDNGPPHKSSTIEIVGDGFYFSNDPYTTNIRITFGNITLTSKDITIDGVKLFVRVPTIEDMKGEYSLTVAVTITGGFFFPQTLHYTYFNTSMPPTNIPTDAPVYPPIHYIDCTQCLGNIDHNLSWCVSESGVGLCTMDNSRCNKVLEACPRYIRTISMNLITSSYSTSTPFLCPHSGIICDLSYKNFVVVNSSQLFEYKVPFIVSDGAVFDNFVLQISYFYCEEANFTLNIQIDNYGYVSRVVETSFENTCNASNTTAQNILLENMYPNISKIFDYNSQSHSITIQTDRNELILTKAMLIVGSDTIDPQIILSTLTPSAVPFCTDCTYKIQMRGDNFLHHDYKCIFSYKSTSVLTYTSHANQIMDSTYSCELNASKLLVFGIINRVNISLSVVPYGYPNVRFSQVNITIFVFPTFNSISEENGFVTISGVGIVYTDDMKIIYNSTLTNSISKSSVQIDGLSIVLKMPPLDLGVYCVKISYGGFFSKCLSLTITNIPTNAPTNRPTNIPTISPTMAPSAIPISPPTSPQVTPTQPPTAAPTQPPSENNQPSLWSQISTFVTEYYWVVIVICVLIIVPIVGLIIYCIKNKKKNSVVYDLFDEDDELPDTEIDINENILVDSAQVKVNYKEVLGKGSSAVVYKGSWRKTNVAVKIIQANRADKIEFIKEVSIMLKLRHPNIVAIMGIVARPHLAILSEYMERKSVSTIINDHTWVIQNHHICKMVSDTCRGMTYLHESNVIHRDLKCGNLLVDHNWTVKVADFGLSRGIEDTNNTMTACGTPTYIAPEVIRRHHYSYKADVYSFAICLLEMCTRAKAWKDCSVVQIILMVGSKNLRPDIPDNVHENFQKIIKACWEDDPLNRPEFSQLVEVFEGLVDQMEDRDDSVGPYPVKSSDAKHLSQNELHDLSSYVDKIEPNNEDDLSSQ